MVIEGVEINTDGVTFGNTVMVTKFEVAGLPVTHANEEVITHDTTSLFAVVVVEYVYVFVPTFAPFTFH